MTCCLLIILLWCFFKVRYLFREVRYVSFRLWHILLTWGLVATPPSQFNPTDYRIPSPCLATSLPPVVESLQGPVALLGGINPARSSWCHPQVNDQSARLLPWKQAHFSGYIFWSRKPWSIRKAFVGMMLASIDWMKEKEILQLDQFGPRRVKTPPLPALESFPKWHRVVHASSWVRNPVQRNDSQIYRRKIQKLFGSSKQSDVQAWIHGHTYQPLNKILALCAWNLGCIQSKVSELSGKAEELMAPCMLHFFSIRKPASNLPFLP